jgi:hypothetical protein
MFLKFVGFGSLTADPSAWDELDLCPLCESKLCAAAAVPKQTELFG